MTLRKSLLALLCVCVSLVAGAQDIDSMLSRLSRDYPEEVVYVQTDKSHFVSNDTAWFKAYIMQNGVPSVLSTTLLADLADASGKLVGRTLWPVLEGSAAGFFSLKDLKAGVYQFRAYTPWMMNNDTAFFFRKNIVVVETGNAKPAGIPFDFGFKMLPEGGNWVSGVVNNMAFIVRGSNGMPVQVKGKIVEEGTEEAITDFQSIHDGMGNFLMVPQEGKTYTAVVEAEGKTKRFPLPPATSNTVSLRVQQTSQQLLFQLQSAPMFKTLMPNITVAAYMNQQLVYKAIAQVGKLSEGISGRIPLKGLPTGVLVLTVFADNWKPVAERICFVKDDSTALPLLTLKPDTLSVKPRGLNVWELNLPEGAAGNLSMSITDADRVPGTELEENLLTRFQLTGELKGRVYNPGWYLSKPYDSTRKALDLLLLTQGWRKYNWEVMAKGFFPPIRVKPEQYLTLKGDVSTASGRKSLPNQELMLIMAGKDSSKQILTAMTDITGTFKMPGMVFFDTVNVYYQLNKSKGDAKDVLLRLSPSVPSLMTALPPLAEKNAYFLEDTAMRNLALNRKNIFDRLYGQKGVLDEVIVRARKKSPLQVIDEKYATGLFSSDNATSFDFINEPPMGMMDIFQFLQGRVAGLQVSGMGANASLSYRGGAPSLFLDQMPVDAQMLSGIPVTDIALVKVFRPPFFGGAGGGANGAIAIFTKRGGDGNSSVPGLEKTTMAGYNQLKQFYSPDYELDPEANPYGDFRSTILWQPYILVGAKERKTAIRFYNNDVTTRYRIVVEGVDAEGRLLRLEKLVQ